MEQTILSVSDCLALVNQTLEYAYPVVVVEGEVASFKTSKGKYVFFDLKDDSGVLSCFMMAYNVRAPLEDGMKIRVVAAPRLTAWGKFSLNVRQVGLVGEGSIKRSFELLKAKLTQEGLFDASRKRLLPSIPERIGLIASVESAGYHDFIKILHSRWVGVEIIVADVHVQGVAASNQIVQALSYFNQQAEPVDAVVIVRGGGSAEDLAVFNDEPLVRAVAASRVPTLVGVGHEIDVSLCDLAADVRAATPSNAAEILVPDKQVLLREVWHKQQRMIRCLQDRTKRLEEQVEQTAERLLNNMHNSLQAQLKQLGYAEQLLKQLDPKTVLRRGYALVRDEQGQIVKQANDVKKGDRIFIELQHAIIKTGVEDVKAK